MKIAATLILAAAMAAPASLASAAVFEPAPIAGQAAPYEALEAPVGYTDGWAHPRRHDHSCIGQAQGTAHAACGSLTGGPSGGLF